MGSSSLNSSNSSHSLSSKGSSLPPSSSSSLPPSSSSGQLLCSLSNSNSVLHLLSSSLLQEHSGPLLTSRTRMPAISKFTPRTLLFSSSSSASSQHRALPRGDQRLPGLQLQRQGGSLSQE